MKHLQIIDNSTFVMSNIFDLNQDPFDGLLKDYNAEDYVSYLNYIWMGWLIVVYHSELGASVIYDYLSKNDSIIDKNFFIESAVEEKLHGDIIEKMLQKLIPTFSPTNIEHVREFTIGLLKDKSLCEQLVIFLCGELALLVPAAQFYKQTKNQNKKDLLAIFLADESNHIANLQKIFTLIVSKSSEQDKQSAWNTFVEICKVRRYFCYGMVTSYLQRYQDPQVRFKKFNSIYATPWHQEQTNILMDRYYKMAVLLDPAITFNKFMDITEADSSLPVDKTLDLSFYLKYNV